MFWVTKASRSHTEHLECLTGASLQQHLISMQSSSQEKRIYRDTELNLFWSSSEETTEHDTNNICLLFPLNL